MNEQRTSPLCLQVRWLIRRDMPEVLAIDHASHDGIWEDTEYLHALRQRNCIGMVAENTSTPPHVVVGAMVYELFQARLVILRFCVHPGYRRQGVGRAMIERLVDKLGQQRRKEISVLVPECNLPAQSFLRAMGFRCERIVRNEHADDDYEFRFRLKEQP